YGDKGLLVCPSYSNGIAYTNDGEVIKKFGGSGDHFGNFLQAVRSRKREDLHADILEGHLSSALCHLGNLSYRLGTQVRGKKKVHPFGDCKGAGEAFTSMIEHLKQNKIEFNDVEYRLGRKLTLDPATERFVGDSDANALLTREYRKGFVV